jgi:hypothetical protein
MPPWSADIQILWDEKKKEKGKKTNTSLLCRFLESLVLMNLFKIFLKLNLILP